MNRAAVGRSYQQTVVLDSRRDDRLRRLLRAGPRVGDNAHPLLAACPLSRLFHQAVTDPAIGDQPERMLHVEQVSRFGGDLPIGTPLLATATIADVGRYGMNAAALITTSITVDGRQVFDGTSIILSLGTTADAPLPSNVEVPVPGSGTGPVLASRSVALSADDVREYAEVSGDVNAIHVSEDVARSAGFPTVIVHGMFTLALAAAMATAEFAGGDASRLRGMKARFARALHPGTDVRFSYSETGRPGAHAVSVVANGHRILRHGIIELSDGPGTAVAEEHAQNYSP